MNSSLVYLLNWLQEFGYPALWLAVFVVSAGAPLPIALVLLAAGAFASLGDFNIFLLALTALSAAVCGDSVGYLIGTSCSAMLLAKHLARLFHWDWASLLAQVGKRWEICSAVFPPCYSRY